jgi:flagellar assembly protein FliH
MSLSKNAPKAQAEPRPFEMADFSPESEAVAEEPDLGKIEQFHLMYVGGKIQDPREEAQRLAQKMRNQAEQELDQAQNQAEDIRNQAQEEGYQKGYQQGQKEGVEASQARINAALENLSRAMQALEKAKNQVLANMEAEILALVQAVLDRYFLRQEAVPPELIQSVISQALARVGEAEKINVKVCPKDLEFVEEFKPDLAQELKEQEMLIISPDPEMKPGGCLVETPILQVDATVATRRRRIYKLLEDAFHQDQSLDLAGLVQDTQSQDTKSPETEPDSENQKAGQPAETPSEET